MADSVRKVRYAYVMVPNRAGRGASVLARLREAGVDLLAYSGFPASGGNAQIDRVTDDVAGLRRVAKASGWRLSGVKKGFLVQGDDRDQHDQPQPHVRRSIQKPGACPLHVQGGPVFRLSGRMHRLFGLCRAVRQRAGHRIKDGSRTEGAGVK